MAATAYGIGLQEYEPRPDFSARRDAKGGWSASNSFSMLREVWENYARTHFVKGTKITELYTELSPYWSFLLLDEVEVVSEAGGSRLSGVNGWASMRRRSPQRTKQTGSECSP